jgi:flagellar basal body-associated protein FliL
MTTTTIIILVNVGIIVLGVNFYVIWNLLKKNERLEDVNTQQDELYPKYLYINVRIES